MRSCQVPLLLSVSILLVSSSSTFASIVYDFEDVYTSSTTYTQLTDQQGFDWSSGKKIYVMDPFALYNGQYSGWGYAKVNQSPGHQIAFGLANGEGIISDPNGFNWEGAYFSDYGGGRNVTSTLNVKGYNGSSLLYDQNYSINSMSATWVGAGWTGVTDLHIQILRLGGNWAMDNFTYSSTVPEPSTFAIFGIGLVAFLGAGARRKYKRRSARQVS